MITNSKIVEQILPACILSGTNAHNVAMAIRGQVLLQMQANKRTNRLAKLNKQTNSSNFRVDVIGILSLVGMVLLVVGIL